MALGVGVIISGVISFLMSNSVAVITILITIIGIIGTPYYIRNKISSAQEQKYNQAKASLLDILERHVINDKEITMQRVSNLISAIERRDDVSISDRISTVELFQDLHLRIEESKLDTENKEEYSSKIEEKIEEFREERQIEDLPTEYQIAIEQLESIEDVSAQNIVSRLEEARKERRRKKLERPTGVFSVMLEPWKLLELPADTRRKVVRRMALIIFGYITFIFMLRMYF